MPKWRDFKRFLDRNGWIMYRSSDHFYYKKDLGDGVILYTKVSRGSGEIPAKIWKKILTKDLGITQEEFNKLK